MVNCSPTCQKWTAFIVSLILLLLGILLVTLWDTLFQKFLKYELSLENSGTTGYSMWKETPVPMYMQFYLFNWTNYHEVEKNPFVKPKFEECGPYTYYEHHIKENVTINNNNTITFYNRRIWKYVPESSKGSLQDNITTLNPVAVTVANLVKDKHYLVKRGVNFFFEEKNVKLGITKTVDEFIFEGYDDPLLDLAHKLNITGFNVPFTKFGWFTERNGSITYDGIFNMYTGVDDIEKLGIVNSWNYNKTVSYFPGNCGRVQGTTGELWYPPKNENSVKLFATDLCSSVELFWNGSHTVNGIEGHKFVGTESIFDNGSIYPEMKCFVPDGITQPSGVRNVSLCKFHAPAFVSYAHFYKADPYYRNAIIGMKPIKEEHETYLALEPTTGMPLRVQASFQINLKLFKVEGIDILSNVIPTYMPAFWFKQIAEMTEDLTNQAKFVLVLPAVGRYTGYGMIGIGIFIITIALIITYRKGWKQSAEECLLNQESL